MGQAATAKRKSKDKDASPMDVVPKEIDTSIRHFTEAELQTLNGHAAERNSLVYDFISDGVEMLKGAKDPQDFAKAYTSFNNMLLKDEDRAERIIVTFRYEKDRALMGGLSAAEQASDGDSFLITDAMMTLHEMTRCAKDINYHMQDMAPALGALEALMQQIEPMRPRSGREADHGTERLNNVIGGRNALLKNIKLPPKP